MDRSQGATDEAPLNGLGDVELVRAHLAGSPQAFNTLFERYHRQIYALTFRLSGDRAAAEDLTQETFLQVLKTIRRLDDDTFNVSAWIHRIASNLAYDQLRGRKRLPEAATPRDPDHPDPAAQVPDSTEAADPERALAGKELRRRIWEVSQTLPENYRLILHLRELQGMSYQQIAEALGISDSAVETMLFRARIRFKEQYLLAEIEGTEQASRCDGVRPLFRQYLAGRLKSAQRRLITEHLESCDTCREACRAEDQRRRGTA